MISTDQIKSRLLQYVTKNPGCTAIEVVTGAEIAGEDYSLDLPTLIEQLVDRGELTELEYILATMDYRVKSLLFPKGSNIELSTNKEKEVMVSCNGKIVKNLPAATKITLRRH